MTTTEGTGTPGQGRDRPRGGLLAGRRRAGTTAPVPAPAPIEATLPRGVRVAGAWSWRLLAIAGVIAVVIYLVVQLRLIVIPLLIAVLIGALLVPFSAFLHRHRWPRWLAIVTALLTLIVVIGGLIYLAVWQVTRESSSLNAQSITAYKELRAWLTTGPLGLSPAQIDGYLKQLGSAFQQQSQFFISGALSVGTTVGHVLTGVLLTLFSLIFILIDGKGIWNWIVHIFPHKARAAVDGAGHAGWATLTSFVKVQVLVATIDAIGIGLGAFILGLPLVIPITVLVFLGSFIPIVGAVLTGALAVFIALIFKGWVFALIMLLIVLGVQQLEGHVLQPFIMGTAVKVHPLAVVLVVAAGSLLAGIPGALFAVPLAAVLNVMVRYVSSGVWRTAPPGDPSIDEPIPVLWETVPRPARRPR